MSYYLIVKRSTQNLNATIINGEDKNPSLENVLAVAKDICIKEKQTKDITLDIKGKCLSLVD